MPTPAHRTIQTTMVPIPEKLRAFYVSADVSVKVHGGKGKGGKKARKPFHVKVHGRLRSEKHEPDPFKRKGLTRG